MRCLSNAQVVSDGTLPTPSVVASPDNHSFFVTGGTKVNNRNLFHSFRLFSVPINGAVVFQNPKVENIISRVIGNSASQIDGLISANANFFLINPKGIIFGGNSALDINGSVIFSTANRVNFADGQFFSTDISKPPLLSLSVPTGLQLNGNAGSINITGAFLGVQPGNSIVLVGNGISMEGGILFSPLGRVELGSVSDSLEVSLQSVPDGFKLGFLPDQNFQDISFTQEAIVNIPDVLTGPIRLYGKNISLAGNSAIIAFENSPDADIEIFATESLSLNESSSINLIDSNGGTIFVNAKNLLLSDFSVIDSSTLFSGARGNIRVNASEYVRILNGSSLSNFTIGNDTGNISVFTKQLVLRDGGQINSTTAFGASGNAGNIHIEATESIEITGRINPLGSQAIKSNVFAGTVDLGTIGNGGNIQLKTKRLSITNSGTISVASLQGSLGQAGTLSINASDYVVISGTDTSISAESGSRLPAGDITFNTDSFRILDGATVSVSTTGSGKAGTIQIKSDNVHLAGQSSGLFTTTNSSGAGGDIFIDTQLFRVSDRAVIDARTTGSGKGGDLFVQANLMNISSGGQLLTTTSGPNTAGNISLQVLDSIILEGRDSGLFANTDPGSTGSGGNINIDPRLVLIQNGAEIAVNSEGSGLGGSIDLESKNLILSRGAISATSRSNIGGAIFLSIADTLLLRNNSQISTTAAGEGTGGSIDINSSLIVAFPAENSDITANAFNGEGGRITINTKGIFGLDVQDKLTELSDITAFSQNNPQLNGIVEIINPEVDPSENLSEQPEAVEPPQEIAQGCRPGQALGDSSFVHVGRGGLPTSPYETQTATNVWQDLRAHKLHSPITSALPSSTSGITPPSLQIVEAKGWIKNSQGQIYLTAKMHKPNESRLTVTTTCSPKILN